MFRKKIFWEPYGGLGDALAFSTLPELAWNKDNSVFFLSTKYQPRNSEILDFVWGSNPYVAGWARGPADLGFGNKYKPLDGGNFISDIEAANGFVPQNSRPKYHYTPSRLAEIADKVLVDLSSTTIASGPYGLSTYSLEKELESNDESLVFVLPTKIYSSIGQFFCSPLTRGRVFPIRSLYEYADALASAKGFIGLQSGALSLGVGTLEYNPQLTLTALMHPALMKSDFIRRDRNNIYTEVSYISVRQEAI